MNKNLISLLYFVFFIVGCQQSSAPSKEAVSEEKVSNTVIKSIETETESASEKKELTSIEKLTLRLIEKGEQAFDEKRFLTPEEDNANLYFQVALGRDPGNFRATQGIANIVETYTDWAWLAARAKDYKKADRYLESARSVNPEDPLIIEVDARINDLIVSRKNETQYKAKQTSKKGFSEDRLYLLPKTLFSMNDDEVIEKMQPIIDAVAKTEQSIVINWPNDKEARLIYQIINSRVSEFRVRAMTFRRADYTVELQQD